MHFHGVKLLFLVLFTAAASECTQPSTVRKSLPSLVVLRGGVLEQQFDADSPDLEYSLDSAWFTDTAALEANIASTAEGDAILMRRHKDDLIAAVVEKSPTAFAHHPTAYQQAVSATVWSFVATFFFGIAIVLPFKGGASCVDFFTAFLVEKSLSVDNLFVFLMIFDYFQVPEESTQIVLKWGILSALVLRGIMIAAGVMVINKFRPVLLIFSLILVASAIKMIGPEEEHHNLAQNPIVKLCRSLFASTDQYDGQNFFSVTGGIRKATPLFIVLMVVELSDIMFAIDSIPAVVGVTQDPLIVYSSNIFALMALRSLYTVLAKSVDTLCYLKQGVALILLFIGSKMTLEYFHIHLPKWASPTIIFFLLSGSTLASLWELHQRRARDQISNTPDAATATEGATGIAAAAAAIAGNALV